MERTWDALSAIALWKHSGNYMHHLFFICEGLNLSHTVRSLIWYASTKKQRLFPLTVLTDRIL